MLRSGLKIDNKNWIPNAKQSKVEGKRAIPATTMIRIGLRTGVYTEEERVKAIALLKEFGEEP